MKYRKKPVVIEAFRYDGDLKNENGEYNIPQWAVEAHDKGTLFFDGPILKVKTLEGDMVAEVGDYIIKGIKDELYPCKSDIFEATYEEVAESQKTEDQSAKKMKQPVEPTKESKETTETGLLKGLSLVSIADGVEQTSVASHQTLSSIEKTTNGIKISFESTKTRDVKLSIDGKQIANVTGKMDLRNLL